MELRLKLAFQFTPLVRGATMAMRAWMSRRAFQFTPLVRGATRSVSTSGSRCSFNSRPSCEGRPVLVVSVGFDDVSIHAPRARGDRRMAKSTTGSQFQFTPLVRGATPRSTSPLRSARFNSRPSCEGRPVTRCVRPLSRGFNSRPSCEGRLCLDN